MSDNAMNIPDDAPSDVQEESPTSLFILQRGATRREVNASEARHFVQGILSRSINLATLIGSGASTPAIPLMGEPSGTCERTSSSKIPSYLPFWKVE